MRVALISPLFESVPPRLYGGTERVVHSLCRGLHEANVEVTLFASGDSSCEASLVPIIDAAIRLHSPSVGDVAAYNFKMLAEAAKRSGDFDVIHNHHDYWMLPLTQMTDTPVVSTLHGRMDLPDTYQAFIGYKEANFISISDSQRAPVPQLNWLRTIRHGIDLEGLTFQPRAGKYLAFLGRMTPEKRPELAIEISRKSGIPLKMAAKIEEGASHDYYERYVKPHVDGKFVEYVGEISESEKSEFLGGALALAFPIDWPEPFGLVMIESLACGTPVLARPCGSVNELLRDGVTGYSSLDIDLLASRALEIEKLDRRACRQWVVERFSLARMTEDYIDVYRDLIGGAERRARNSGRGRRLQLDRDRRNFLHSFQRSAEGNT